MTVTGEWMQSFVARASFNLGFMHQFGIGIAQDADVEAFVGLVASCLVWLALCHLFWKVLVMCYVMLTFSSHHHINTSCHFISCYPMSVSETDGSCFRFWRTIFQWIKWTFPSSDMKDLNLAKQHYFRCREVDPSGLHAPVTLALAALACHLWLDLWGKEDRLTDTCGKNHVFVVAEWFLINRYQWNHSPVHFGMQMHWEQLTSNRRVWPSNTLYTYTCQQKRKHYD